MSRNGIIRIASASGSGSDRRDAIASLARNYPQDPINVIIGDWLSEANMTAQAARKAAAEPAFEITFLEALEPALDDISKYGIRLAANAGASDTQGLWRAVVDIIKKKGLKLKVAWISGDDVMAAVRSRLIMGGKSGEFTNICTGEKLMDWKFEPIGAQAYLGGLGIAAAFEHGADIVICGRVSDASPVIGAAYWWHGWCRDDLLQLANAFVAGHLIECSTYVCGGNFSGFKALEGRWLDIGFPIAEISKSGDVVITKQKSTGGMISVDTCRAQLLYEIQGPWYFNSDVTAILDDISFEQLGPDRVALRGVRGSLPPPTTKVGITAHGGFQAEFHFFIVGLDMNEKARMMEAQIRHAIDSSEFHCLKFTTNGTAAENPRNQPSATVDFRVFAQSSNADALSPQNFLKPVFDTIMATSPGATPHLDFRQGFPKPCFEYYVTLLPQTDIKHTVQLQDGTEIPIAPPTKTKVYGPQPSFEESRIPRRDFGPTTRGPLGWIVHGRSGDKGSNANVGFWVRTKEEYSWLANLLSVAKMKQLLAEEYNGKQIDRFELPNMYAVHFLLHDHLDRGVSCTSSYDFLAKNVAEYLRSRHVDLPVRFLNRGKL